MIVLICPRDEFTGPDQSFLDQQVLSLMDYVELDVAWWTTQSTVNCIELGYGGAACTQRCCSAPHGPNQLHFALNARRAVISNADTSRKSLFLYGTSDLNGDDAYQDICGTGGNNDTEKCWSNWAGTDYNPLTNNCNTFTSAILACILGLSEKKPHLGPSDMITVTCDKCPRHSPEEEAEKEDITSWTTTTTATTTAP
jgi:hypothetical protein